MADRPIIFSAPMVRALLAGTKTQTRRVLKPAPFIDGMGNFFAPDRKGRIWNWVQNPDGSPCLRRFVEKHAPCAVGDRLWVKEAWSHSGIGVWTINAARMCGRGGVFYRADREAAGAKYWASIHMPREFSRLTLTVTAVKGELLQDISEADAASEGVAPTAGQSDPPGAYRIAYRNLWNTLHGPDAWAANPCVAAYTFTVEQRNIDMRAAA